MVLKCDLRLIHDELVLLLLGFYGLNIFHLNVKGLSLPNCLPSAQWMAQVPDIMTTARMLGTVRPG